MNTVIVDEVLVTEVPRTDVLVTPAEQGPPGPPGPAGQQGAPGEPGLRVAGAVDSAGLLPASANPGDVWVTRDDGHGHAWNGAAWVDIGPAAIPGPPGTKGKDGQIRYTGHGAPGVILGAEAGDTYLDLLTGEIYKLS